MFTTTNKSQAAIYESLEKGFRENTHKWNKPATSEYQKKRFAIIKEMAESVHPKHILDIGCGTGYLTEELAKVTSNITGIDVSKTAIEQAQKRLPEITFYEGSLNELGDIRNELKIPGRPFDLIVASEILYYIKDQKTALSTLFQLGNYLITSNFIASKKAFSLSSLLTEYHLYKYKFKPLKRKLHIGNWTSCLITLWEL